MDGTSERILRIKEVLVRTGLTRSTLYRKMSDGAFPRQLRIAARCAGWRQTDVEAWLRDPMFYTAEQ
jgi:prophage regulatory protein